MTADPTVAVVRTGDQGVHVMPWDNDAKAPVYGHRPAADCPCGPMEQRDQFMLGEWRSIFYHDSSFEVAQRVL
jgi:hypothetical protein